MSHKNIHVEKLAIFSANNETNEWQIREYVARNWTTLTEGLKNTTILFIAGAHGLEDGKLSEPTDSVEVLKVQFSRIIKEQYPKVLEDQIPRGIRFDFLNVTEFYRDWKSREIDVEALEKSIRQIDPRIVILVICFSRTLDLKFMLEGKEIFAELRIQTDLNLISKGRILTLNETQKKFISMLAQNIETKIVRIEGRVGSGKTMLGIQAIKMKLSHYIRKYGFSIEEAKQILQVIIWISSSSGRALMRQLTEEFKEDFSKCSTVKFLYERTSIYQHTLVFMDKCEIHDVMQYDRKYEFKLMIDKVDYIYAFIHYNMKILVSKSKVILAMWQWSTIYFSVN